MGLVEHLAEAGGRQDLYVLARSLQLELDDLLPLIEGLAILGLAVAEEGDAVLTDLGRRFAEADVLGEKELYREQVTRNVELVRQIVRDLQSNPEHSFKPAVPRGGGGRLSFSAWRDGASMSVQAQWRAAPGQRLEGRNASRRQMVRL